MGKEKPAGDMKLKHWVLFVVVQCAGFLLPSLANFHNNNAPLIFGVVLLLPGSVIAFVFPQLSGGLHVVAISGTNAVVWYLAARLGSKELRL